MRDGGRFRDTGPWWSYDLLGFMRLCNCIPQTACLAVVGQIADFFWLEANGWLIGTCDRCRYVGNHFYCLILQKAYMMRNPRTNNKAIFVLWAYIKYLLSPRTCILYLWMDQPNILETLKIVLRIWLPWVWTMFLKGSRMKAVMC